MDNLRAISNYDLSLGKKCSSQRDACLWTAATAFSFSAIVNKFEKPFDSIIPGWGTGMYGGQIISLYERWTIHRIPISLHVWPISPSVCGNKIKLLWA